MVVYNCGTYIHDAIQSVLEQTHKYFELVIVDDGSSDNTIDVINSFSDNRIKVIRQKSNLGVSHARNLALKHSLGKYIAIIDADDVAVKTRFEKQINYLKNNDIDVVASQHDFIDANSNYLEQPVRRSIPKGQEKSYFAFYNICNSTVMYKKDIVDNFDPVYNNQLGAEDYDLFSRLSFFTHFHILPDILMKVRKREGSLCSENWEYFSKIIDVNRIKVINELGLYPDKDNSIIHSKLVNKEYEDLHNYSLSEIFCWINKILLANNKQSFFPNPFFNEEWYKRLRSILKYRKQKKIIDLYRYNKIASLIVKKHKLSDLISIYFRS